MFTQPPPQALRFSHGRGERETSDWWWTARDHGKGIRPMSPSRLPLRAHLHQKRDVWVRGRCSHVTRVLLYALPIYPFVFFTKKMKLESVKCRCNYLEYSDSLVKVMMFHGRRTVHGRQGCLFIFHPRISAAPVVQVMTETSKEQRQGLSNKTMFENANFSL